jgi:trans-aconitate 2-methyltransferase
MSPALEVTAASPPDARAALGEQARQYFHNSDPQRIIAERALARLALRGDEHVLDWGCGDGKISATLSFRVPRATVLGMDVSAEMIGVASTKYPPRWYPNLTFLRVAPPELAAWRPPRLFDLVVSFSVLHVVPDPASTVAAMAAALAGGGRLLVASTGPTDPRQLEAMRAALVRCGVPVGPMGAVRPGVDITDRDQLEGLLVRAGLRRVSIELVDASYVFLDGNEFTAWNRGVTPPGARLPPDAERRFHSYLLEEQVRLDPSADRGGGAVAVRFPHFVVSAEKD